MAKQLVTVGATSRIEYVRITDMNASPITGLVFNSTSLASKYFLSGGTATAITLATLAAGTSAYSSGGFIEMDSTAFPGVYRFDIPNAVFASGNKAFVSLYGYSGMNTSVLEYELTAFDLQTANVTVGTSSDKTGYALSATQTFSNTGTWTGNVTGSVGSVTTVSDKTGYSLSSTQTYNNTGTWTGPVTGSVGSVSGAVGSVTGAVGSVTGNVGGNVVGSVGSLTTNNDKTGYSLVAGQLAVKKNTQLTAFTFPMTSTSGVPTSGLTVTATVSIDGGAFGAATNSVTEISNGWYKITLAAADLNGTVIALRFAATGALDTDITLITQA